MEYRGNVLNWKHEWKLTVMWALWFNGCVKVKYPGVGVLKDHVWYKIFQSGIKFAAALSYWLMDQSATAPLIRYAVSYCCIVRFFQGSGVCYCRIVRSILGPDVCYFPIVRFIQGSDVCYCPFIRSIQGSHVCSCPISMFHSRILCLLALPEGHISDISIFVSGEKALSGILSS